MAGGVLERRDGAPLGGGGVQDRAWKGEAVTYGSKSQGGGGPVSTFGNWVDRGARHRTRVRRGEMRSLCAEERIKPDPHDTHGLNPGPVNVRLHGKRC